MDVSYLLLARHAQTGVEGGFSALGAGVDTEFVPGLPFFVPSLYVVLKMGFERDEAMRDHTLRIRVLDPDGEEVIASTDTLIAARDDFPPTREHLLINIMLGLLNLVLPKEGVYRFQALCDGQVVKETRLRVEQQFPAVQSQNSDVERGTEQ
jgi:hypothetical protein